MIQDRAERIMALHYRITVKEYLEDSWAAWFDGLMISPVTDEAPHWPSCPLSNRTLRSHLAEIH